MTTKRSKHCTVGGFSLSTLHSVGNAAFLHHFINIFITCMIQSNLLNPIEMRLMQILLRYFYVDTDIKSKYILNMK